VGEWFCTSEDASLWEFHLTGLDNLISEVQLASNPTLQGISASCRWR
jgi:hypothetical protein